MAPMKLITLKPITPSRFRTMRKRLGLSQKKLSKWFGTSDQSVARWEKGKSEIPGPARVLIWLLYDEQINGNKSAVRDYVKMCLVLPT
jgi:putative transcriptional regulator